MYGSEKGNAPKQTWMPFGNSFHNCASNFTKRLKESRNNNVE